MAKHEWRTIRLAAAVVPTLWSTGSLAQTGGQGAPEDTPPPSQAPEATSGSSSASSGGTTVIVKPVSPPTTTTTTTYQPWGLPPPGQGGQGAPQDPYAFSLGGGSGTTTVRGNANGSYQLTGKSVSVPAYHTVRRGDTLWDLCDHYYDNPWMWPRLWSYNPQVENPHWIYPGDRLRLKPKGAVPDQTRNDFVSSRGVIPRGTVFLRDRGYIGEDKRDIWGKLVGSPDDQMLLSQGDEVYLSINKGHHLQPGRDLTLFHKIRKPEKGKPKDGDGHIVEIVGTVHVDEWNPKTRIARGQITESLDVIERGTLVGPVGRRFDVVPPRRNDRQVKAIIMGAVKPREIIGQNQIVFIDKGSDDGLRPGNRLFVIERGDRWEKSSAAGKLTRMSVRYQLKKAEVEKSPNTLRGKEKKLPKEVVGEIRVLRTKKHSSTCLVTYSEFELAPGQAVIARRGY